MTAQWLQVDNSAWECPPGLGVCPLDVIFGTCKIIHNYLRSSEEHVVVSPKGFQTGFFPDQGLRPVALV